MRAIAGMTQEKFAQRRGISARGIKALELGQGNPTLATLKRIGEFFGLEVALVPVRREPAAEALRQPANVAPEHARLREMRWFETVIEFQKVMQETQVKIDADTRALAEQIVRLDNLAGTGKQAADRARGRSLHPTNLPSSAPPPVQEKDALFVVIRRRKTVRRPH